MATMAIYVKANRPVEVSLSTLSTRGHTNINSHQVINRVYQLSNNAS